MKKENRKRYLSLLTICTDTGTVSRALSFFFYFAPQLFPPAYDVTTVLRYVSLQWLFLLMYASEIRVLPADPRFLRVVSWTVYLPRRRHVSRRTKRSWGTPRWHLRTPGTDRRSRSCNTGSRVLCPAADIWRPSLPASPYRPPGSPSRWCGCRPDGDSTDCHVLCTTGSTVVATFAWSVAASSTYYYYRTASFPARPDSFIVSRADTRISHRRGFCEQWETSPEWNWTWTERWGLLSSSRIHGWIRRSNIKINVQERQEIPDGSKSTIFIWFSIDINETSDLDYIGFNVKISRIVLDSDLVNWKMSKNR